MSRKLLILSLLFACTAVTAADSGDKDKLELLRGQLTTINQHLTELSPDESAETVARWQEEKARVEGEIAASVHESAATAAEPKQTMRGLRAAALSASSDMDVADKEYTTAWNKKGTTETAYWSALWNVEKKERKLSDDITAFDQAKIESKNSKLTAAKELATQAKSE